jgi:hypothetical protein
MTVGNILGSLYLVCCVGPCMTVCDVSGSLVEAVDF